MKHDKITPDLAVLRARAQKANKTRSPVRITKARRAPPAGDRTLASAHDFVPASPRSRANVAMAGRPKSRSPSSMRSANAAA